MGVIGIHGDNQVWGVGDGEVDDGATDTIIMVRWTCQLTWHQNRIEYSQGVGDHVVGKHLRGYCVASSVEIQPVRMSEVEVSNQYERETLGGRET